MGRGPSLKSQRKRAHDLAFAEEKGRLDAQLKAHQKKPLEESFKEHLGKLIDTLDTEDIIKIIGVGSIAYIIQPIVKNLPSISAYIAAVGPYAAGQTMALFNPISLFIQLTKTPPPVEIPKDSTLDDSISWMLSIGIACLIVQFGPAILESIGGVGKLATLFLIA